MSVESLWKVFGPDPQRGLAQEYADWSKEDLQSQLGVVVALRDVSFDVQDQETFVVMGLSGSGKSTLVRTLIRLIEPTAGRIRMFGENILEYSDSQLAHFRRHKAAMVFQHYGLLPHRTVIENAAWGLEVQGIPREERQARAQEMLDLVGLRGWESNYPNALSGGMQQRVGLARALTVDPEILLMDEPFSGLDPLIRREMQDELLRIQEELHKTIVFITHDLDEALKIGDRIAIMRDGSIVQIGSPEDIVLNPEDEYVGEFTQDVRRATVLTAAHVMSPARVVVSDYQGPRAVLHALRSSDAPVALVVGPRGRYVGALSVEQAVIAAREGVQRVRECVDTEVPTVSPDASFDELTHVAMAAEHLVPVVDESGKLLGEVHRTAMATMVRDHAEGGETVPADDVPAEGNGAASSGELPDAERA